MLRRMIPRIVAVVAVAGTVAIGAQAVAPPLKIAESRAQEFAIDTITSGPIAVSFLPAKAFLALPPAGRAAAVTAAFAWRKAYTSSPVFQKAYATRREDVKPVLEASGSAEEEFKKKQAEQAQSLEEQRKAVASMPADVRASMESAFAQIEAQMKDPQMIALMRMSAEAEIKDKRDRYDRDMETWTRDYPADPRILIARRLQRFLDESAGVDYDAALLPPNAQGLKKFANPEYETKSGYWRLCYRAGREAVTEGRAQAQAWLKALPPGQ